MTAALNYPTGLICRSLALCPWSEPPVAALR
jgi:hypothetical protein